MYCEITDIESYYQGKSFDCSSYVTSERINTFIITETAVINSTLRKRYSLPITNTEDLLILKMICEKLVVGTVDDIIQEKDPEGNLERSRGYRKEAMDMLNKIAKGEMILNKTEKSSVIKFNNVDSEGNEVEKQIKVSEIEPSNTFLDSEHKTIIRVD